ncbi:M14 family metallopeptidase [candidate division KSB1 bacterium]
MKRPMLSCCSILVTFSAILLLFSASVLPQITPPEEYLGYKPGADFHLMTYEDALGYFELIAGQTDRMIMLDMGVTSEGRRMKYGVISSPENLARLDHYKEINRKISLVDGVDDDEAKRLAAEGKAIVWIDGGLHGTEVAPAQLLPQLAYDLLSGTDRQSTMIRENVITLLVFANPDGMTIVSDWYMGNVGTPYEVSPIPWLYHKYVGHDNNRDSFMSNLIETQNMNQSHSRDWYPHVLYNQHQTGPFPARIWIPPDAEPTNPNVHPLVVRWKNLIGGAMGKAFEENNMPGVISRVRYDTWYPGYATQVVDGHNVVSILTETQLYKYATPQHFTVNDFPPEHREMIKGVFYPNPWPGGWWRLGDAVAYNNTACKAVLEVAARYKYELIYDKYVAGADVVERFKAEPPYGWIISTDQSDKSSTALLIERMMVNGIDVYTADAAFEHNGLKYPAGSFILPTSQPFGLFLKNIFEKQVHPDLREYSHLWQGLVNPEDWKGAPLRPYDGVGWTLPMQMGVDSKEMSSALDVGMTKVEQLAWPVGESSSSGSFVFSCEDNRSFTAAFQLLKGGATVKRSQEAFTLNGQKFPVGSFIVDRGKVSGNDGQRIAEETGVRFISGKPAVETTTIKTPRIGLYKSWVASMDAGWITYVFDDFKIDYQAVTNAEIRAGQLSDRFDVIILADQGTGQIIEGHAIGTIPPDYVGGIGDEGVIELRKFVKNGGTLVCNNSSSDLPIEYFDLPVKNVLARVPADSFNCPGALLKGAFDTSNRFAQGMQDTGMIFFSRGRVFEIDDTELPEENEVTCNVIAEFPDEYLLMSGWMIGDEMIRGKAAALDVSFGKGRIALFGFNVHNRAQAHSTMKMLFNSLFIQ